MKTRIPRQSPLLEGEHQAAVGPHANSADRALIVYLGILISLQSISVKPVLIMPLILFAGMVMVTARFCSATERESRRIWSRSDVAGVVFLGLALVACGTRLASLVFHPLSLDWWLLLVPYAVLGCAAALAGPRRYGGFPFAFAGFLLAQAVLMVVVLSAPRAPIDVAVYVHDGVRALVAGHDPYGLTFANPFTHAQSRQLFGPGVIQHGRIVFGFPYLPAVLFGTLPGYLLGDPRYSLILALVVFAATARKLATDRTGRMLAVAAAATPWSPELIRNSFVEPLLMLGLCALVLALRNRSRMGGALLFGLWLATKQYLVVILPLVRLLQRRLGTGVVAGGLAITAAIVAAFFAWDPAAFWRAVVAFQFRQPLRHDSVSLLVAVGDTFGHVPIWLYGVAPLMAGLAVSSVIAWRARPTPTAFAAGVGLSLLATLLFSKQAFMNYYSLVGAALIIACITWPSDASGPVPATPPDPAQLPV